MHNVFHAGVEPGGLTADYEIKMLICYVLNTVHDVPISILIEALATEGIANYFEIASAASGLVKTGHITIEIINEERRYTITELGIATADNLANSLPPVIREKAVLSVIRSIESKELHAGNRVEIKKVTDGYLLTLVITDVGSDLLTSTILVPDHETCIKISERFVKDPVLIYKGIVAVLTGSFASVGPLLDSTLDSKEPSQ